MLKPSDNLTMTTTRAKDFSRLPHLKDLNIPGVDDNQVTLLIGANVPEAKCMKNVGEGDQESRMLFERYWVGLCLDQ